MFSNNQERDMCWYLVVVRFISKTCVLMQSVQSVQMIRCTLCVKLDKCKINGAVLSFICT